MMAFIGVFMFWLTARQLRIATLRDRQRQRGQRWTKIDAYLPMREREDA